MRQIALIRGDIVRTEDALLRHLVMKSIAEGNCIMDVGKAVCDVARDPKILALKEELTAAEEFHKRNAQFHYQRRRKR